jgi:2-dehydro-3-deoxygluconokinase
MTAYSTDLIGLGECMVELHAKDSLGQAAVLHKAYGGDVINSLVTASRLGCRTAFVSRVGDDPFGQGLLQSWQTEGINTHQAPLVPGENGVYFISVDADGERQFTYRRTGSAASRLTPQDLEPEQIAASRMLLVSGITQAISPSARATTLAAVELARQHGVVVAYDPNYRPKLWQAQGGLAAACAAFAEICASVDVFLLSSPADLPVLGKESTLETLAATALVAVKLGAEGAVLLQHTKRWTIPAAPTTTVLDTTGAGDAWNGTFLAGLLQRQSPLEAAQKANRVAAVKLAFRGAIAPRDSLETMRLV